MVSEWSAYWTIAKELRESIAVRCLIEAQKQPLHPISSSTDVEQVTPGDRRCSANSAESTCIQAVEADRVDSWRILKNPVYAGAFAYGRTSTRSRIIEGRARKTAGNSVPMEQWVGTISFWYSTG